MSSQVIEIKGMVELDLQITVPDGQVIDIAGIIGQAVLSGSKQVGTEVADKTPVSAFPDTLDGRQAEAVADALKEAGKAGMTIKEIERRFGAIRTPEHCRRVCDLLPELLYRKTYDTPAGGSKTALARYTYFYA